MNTTGQPAPSRAPRWIGLGALAAAVIGAAVYFGVGGVQTPDDVALGEVVPAQDPAPQTLVEESATPDPQPQDTAAATEEPATVAPTFDEVRQEADGLTVIAGRADPGSTVTVLVDGVEAAEAVADARGSFAAVGVLDPSSEGSVVTLRQGSGNEGTISAEEIILAPLPEVPGTVDMDDETAAKLTEAVPDAAEPTPEPDKPSDAPSAPEDGAPAATVSVAQPEADVPDSSAPERPAQVTEEVVPEGRRVAVLKSTQGGVELLQAPPVIETVALDTIGYSTDGDVQLSGRAQPGSAEVRVYLDNRSVAQMDVGDNGRWRGEVPDIAPGIYRLRVDEIDTDGRVSSRVETPFKREAIAVLAEASAQADGPITAITVQRGDTLWAIARDRYGEGPLFVRVFEANRDAIRDPDLIYPGQVFDLPD